jgi:hypothetical protein
MRERDEGEKQARLFLSLVSLYEFLEVSRIARIARLYQAYADHQPEDEDY